MNIYIGANGNFRLDIPSRTGGKHTVSIPQSLDGLRLLRKILMEADATPEPTIGMAAHPTQAQVDAWLKADAAAKLKASAERQAVAEREFKERTGLSLEELGL